MNKIVLKNQESFNLKDIFECGQCFRWNKVNDNSYIGVVKNTVIKVTKENNEIIFEGEGTDNFEKLIYEYFDLNRNYTLLKENLSKIDSYVEESIKYGEGIRILKQDFWECIISYIISANNNIPRIKKIIEKICEKYGNKIYFEGKEYFSFPTPEELSKAKVEDFRTLGAGFRDVRLYETTKKIYLKEFDLDKSFAEKDTLKLRDELLKLDGVGPKVADCILLFGCNRFDVFPIDVWVRRVMNDLYIHNIDEEKVSKKDIEKLSIEKFGENRGLVQQYLFYWKRDNS